MTNPSAVGRAKRPPWMFIAVLAVVVAAGVVAVLATRDAGGKEVEGQTGKVEVGAGASTTEAPAEGDDATTTTAAPDATPGDATTTTTTTGEEPGSAEALPPFKRDGSDDAIGLTIPSVTGQDFDGKPVTIAPDGKAKVLLFVAHWCPHCQREVPLLSAHLADSPLPDDVELITVSTSVQPDADNYPPQAWLEREDWTAPVLADDADSTVASLFGLTGFPYFVIVDAEGKVVQRASGELPVETFDALVEAARTGTPAQG